jgi:heme-degrading monooxygenase HmoA
MAHTIGRVRVHDFDHFLRTFTTRGKQKRGEHGSRGAKIFRSTENPNEAIVIFDWDRADAERFFNDDEAQRIMKEAGVQGPPQLFFAEEVGETDA